MVDELTTFFFSLVREEERVKAVGRKRKKEEGKNFHSNRKQALKEKNRYSFFNSQVKYY